jgi:hypothetical protein
MRNDPTCQSFKETPPTQMIHEVAMPLIAVDSTGAQHFVSGTAFVIGRGWAVTAYHVLEDFAWRYNKVRWRDGTLEASFQLLGMLSLDGDTRHLPLRIMRAWRATPLDIAVLALGVPEDWPNDHLWKVPKISLLPPKIGEPIFGFGFANSSVSQDPSSSIPTVDLHPRTTTGSVVEVHHELRDTARLPFPSFRTNARFDPGMSGGPIFNGRSGDVCGVICSSLPATTDEEDHISYASTLWPIIATLVDTTGTSVSGGTPYPLRRLFENGTLYTEDLANVQLITDTNGLRHAQARYNVLEWETPNAGA